MDKGTKVFKAHFHDHGDAMSHFIMEGVVTEIVKDGVPLVQWHEQLQPFDSRWHARKADAQRDIHRGMIRFIGRMQAKADELAAEILHADLSTEEAAA